MKNQTILMLGYSNWEHWRPTHELARLFAKNNRVIFVERLLGYDDLRWQGVKHIDCLKRFRLKPLRRISQNLFVLQPPPGLFPSSLPVLSRFINGQIQYFSNKFNKILQAKWVRAYLRSRGITPSVLFLNHPTDLHLSGCFGEQISCWWVYDELALSPDDVYNEMLAEIEKKCLPRINLIFASSRRQYTNRKALHPRVFYAPNGVDVRRFDRVVEAGAYEPEDLYKIPGPRLGYIGHIEHLRLDFDLLHEIAETCPQWSLVLIGWISRQAEDSVTALTRLQNVYVLPYKPYNLIPMYLKGIDVGLIPFKITPFSNAMNPLKFYEYMAMGLPVVATAVDELKPYAELVNIAQNPGEFTTLVEAALKDNSPEKALKRRSFAKQNSWERNAAGMSEIIKEYLQKEKVEQ